MTFQPSLPMPAAPAGGLHPALAFLIADPSPAAVATLLAGNRFPLIEPGAATFVYRGEASHVELLRFIHAGARRTPFMRLPGSDLWVLRLAVEDGGRFEYKLAIGRHGGEDWILDPLNPARAGDPFGQNSVCRTLGYARPAWSRPQGAPAGWVEPLPVTSRVFGETRSEQVYLPHGYDRVSPYPVVVIHDGADFLTYADLAVSLDNLIAAGDVPPLVAALIQSPDRMRDYSGGRAHAAYVAAELMPALGAAHALSLDIRERVLLGASLGAVASLSTAFRHPGQFGGLVLNSGTFVFDAAKLARRPHPVFTRVHRLLGALRRAPSLPPTRAYVSTGDLEGLAEENRTLASFLQERGVDVLFGSAWDGHHWHNWRDQLRDGLMWTIGGARDKS
jgi:enterochelin esterase-like enzyme